MWIPDKSLIFHDKITFFMIFDSEFMISSLLFMISGSFLLNFTKNTADPYESAVLELFLFTFN
ncbi:hypothetical protein GCM10007199_05920 [Fictibacillus barbaricus]|nr:hypothetical protein GCM10007199_05920 [Fictibacillus barbaricus]